MKRVLYHLESVIPILLNNLDMTELVLAYLQMKAIPIH